MADELSDRVALVTGAGRGIGRAVAIALAARGMRVALLARNQSQLDVVADEIVSPLGATPGLDLAVVASALRINVLGVIGLTGRR